MSPAIRQGYKVIELPETLTVGNDALIYVLIDSSTDPKDRSINLQTLLSWIAGEISDSLSLPRATSARFGVIKLAGDLEGDAESPTVKGLSDKAPLLSPVFTGMPQAPTPVAADSSSKIATTAFVQGTINVATAGQATPDATATVKGKLQLAGDLGGTAAAPSVPALASKAPINSPVFTGTPTAPTPPAGDSSLRLATTAFVILELESKAPLISPAFTGSPTAPTPPTADTSTRLATTAFVKSAVASSSAPDATTITKGIVQLAGDLAGTADAPTVPGLALKLEHLSDDTAPLLSADLNADIFNLFGQGTIDFSGPTSRLRFHHANAGNLPDPNQYAGMFAEVEDGNEAFFASAGVWYQLAKVESPGLLGIPTAPTAEPGTNTIQIATTAFVNRAVDDARRGLALKPPVRVAVDTNVDLAAPGATLSGVGMSPEQRFLALNQDDRTENGIYVWNGEDVPATRALDADSSQNVFSGIYAWVTEGELADRRYVLMTDGFIVIGVSELDFVQDGGSEVVPEATALVKGRIALAGDLGGTAAAPTVPGLGTKAPLNSPVFTGRPTAPTPQTGDNTNRIATTAFVQLAIGELATPDATATVKGKLQLAGDLAGTAESPTVPGLTNKAPIDSPALTGTPTAPTPPQNDDSDKIATTAFVQLAIVDQAASDATTTGKGIVQLAGDLGGTAAAPTVPGLAGKAPIDSAELQGQPTTPTPTASDRSTRIANTEFVQDAVESALAALPAGKGRIVRQIEAPMGKTYYLDYKVPYGYEITGFKAELLYGDGDISIAVNGVRIPELTELTLQAAPEVELSTPYPVNVGQTVTAIVSGLNSDDGQIEDLILSLELQEL